MESPIVDRSKFSQWQSVLNVLEALYKQGGYKSKTGGILPFSPAKKAELMDRIKATRALIEQHKKSFEKPIPKVNS